MLAQLRISWWREQFARPLGEAPRGEPLLAALREWDPQRAALSGLADGWEAFAAAAPGDAAQGIAQLATARGRAFGALAARVGDLADTSTAERLGEGWALADLAARLVDPAERATTDALIAAHDWRGHRLPRAMRPLAVLHGLAARAVRLGVSIDALPPTAVATALRIGLLGR